MPDFSVAYCLEANTVIKDVSNIASWIDYVIMWNVESGFISWVSMWYSSVCIAAKTN